MTKIALAGVALVLLTITASYASAAEPVFERKVVIKDAKPVVIGDYGGTLWWQSASIKADKATSIRLQFTNLSNPNKQAFDIVVRDKNQRELERIGMSKLDKAQSLVTRRYFGVQEVRATIEAASAPQSIGATLNAYYLGPAKEPKPLSIASVGEPWDAVGGAASLQATVPDPARSVVNLLFPDSDMRNCTGFLVGRDRIMTNNHCIELSSAFLADGKGCSDVLIDLDFLDQGKPVRVRCVDAQADKALDIAVLRVAPSDLSKLSGRPILKLNSAAAMPSVARLMHHPAGMPMRISSKCQAVERLAPSKVQHTCSSLGGSSGAPLINNAGEVIAVQSNGYPEMTLSEYQNAITRGKKFYNLAVDAKMIPKKFKEYQ